MTCSAKKLKLMQICLLHCKKHFISVERNIFHVVELCSQNCIKQLFLTVKEAFEHMWPRIPIICLVALNTELVFLEALEK